MVDLSNNSASLDKQIPLEKLFDQETIENFDIINVAWKMSIKPGIRDVSAYISGNTRMEEIEVLEVHVNNIPDMGAYQPLFRQIHSKIMYPTIVFFVFKDKYKIAGYKATDSVQSANKQVLHSFFLSAWIHESAGSENAIRCANTVRELLLNGKGSIKQLYDDLCNAIIICAPQYIGSKRHLMNILFDMSGNKKDPMEEKIDKTKRYDVSNPNQRYKKREYYSTFKYFYEYEDIWHALLSDDKFRNIILNRRYSCPEDMIMSIDSKYTEW